MNETGFFGCFTVVTVATIVLHAASCGVYATSLSTNFSTEHFSFKTPSDTCDECISRARDYYPSTVSDPEQFCIDNNVCVKNLDTGSQPTEAPLENASTSRNGILELESSLSPNDSQTHELSSLPSDTSSLIPSAMPTLRPNQLLSDKPSLLSSKVPTYTPIVVSSRNPSEISSFEPNLILRAFPSEAPSSISFNFPIISSSPIDGEGIQPSALLDDNTKKDSPSFTPSLQSAIYESSPMDSISIDPTVTDNEIWRTTISSLFLKNISSPMGPDDADFFSIIALDFLRHHSKSLDLVDEIDFILVKVLGQGPELGNSTEFQVHIDGMHVFFETIVNIKGNKEIDLPMLIQTIFKTNKTDFFFRLVESNEFFLPLDVKSPSSREKVESRMSSWLTASLAIVVCSVFATTSLLTTIIQKTRSRRSHQDSSKEDIYPLYTLEQTCSEGSTETNTMGDQNMKLGKGTGPSGYNDSVDISMNMEVDSLVGLKLIYSEDGNSPSFSSRGTESYTEETIKDNELHFENTIDTIIERTGVRQPGYNARLRKRQIELEFQKRKSEEVISMEAILIATSSFNCDEEVGEQQSTIDVAASQSENPSTIEVKKSSIMDQISNIFRTKNKNEEVRRLEPVRIFEEDDSDLSFLSTPVHSPSNLISSFHETAQSDRSVEDISLSILPKNIP